MEVTVNVIELATDLAHNRILEITETQDEEDLYEVDENGYGSYKEDIQDLFNGLYDYYFELITNCQVLKDETHQ